MSDEFSFEEVQHSDWLKDASQFTDKHLYTHSDVSKDHFLEDLLHFSNEHNTHPQTHHHAQQKERTKVNSKNYRDRKRGMLEHMRKQVDFLQKQNQFLRAQKHCRWCQKPFAHPVLFSESKNTSLQHEKNSSYHSKKESLQMEMEFQKPSFFTSKKEERRGKIWIALGILMLVLGITLYGFDGDKREIKEIQIEKEQMARWKEQLHSPSEEYLEVKMRIKEERKSMSKLDNNQLRILYRNEAIQQGPDQESDKISIKKQLLYGIHAELEDIGIYL